MKKLVLAAVAVFAIGNSAMAQEVKFGPKAGVNFANLSGKDDSNSLTGFNVGAVAEVKINEKFSIQPELLYSAQGSKYKLSSNLGSYEQTQKLDYINIPIMAKYYVVEGLSVEAGPQVGFLTKAEVETKANVGSLAGETTVDNKKSFNSVDFGVNFGLGYDLPMGLFVNARYNLGLTDVIKENNGTAVKNNVIQVGLGYKF